MAAVKKRNTYKTGPVRRVSPLKPGLRGARNWASAQVRAAGHTRRGFVKFTASVLALLLLVVYFALWIGGFLPQVKQGVADFKQERLMAMGFVVEQIDVMGEGRLNERDVRAVIGIYPGDYFFGADLKAAQENTESLAWVDRAVVRRLWPNRVVVQLVEVEPYALWQRDGKFALVSADGSVVSSLEDAPNMPAGMKVIIGDDAPRHAADFHQELQDFPNLWARTESMTYLRDGRWDLHLTSGTVVKLPVKDRHIALFRLTQLQNQEQILDREISVIDMRLGDRLTLAPKLEQDA
ncbi:cell division protein FtsQ/DivIB [Litorimonas sp. RW-G-Af-16]|uniref:cell division protein FtsQ/DivIB n=1 Tax=Litorimonas sp. RW-G-Af-16 TaxID=3241168 RepID=UPI00390C5010